MGFPAEFPSSKCWEGFEQKVLSNINKMDHDGSTQYTEIQRLKRPQTVLGSAKIPSQLPWLLSLPPWCENDPPLPALLPPHQSYTMMNITPFPPQKKRRPWVEVWAAPSSRGGEALVCQPHQMGSFCRDLSYESSHFGGN